MAQFHVSKDPSSQLAITFFYDPLLATNLKPQLTKQYYFASSSNRIPRAGKILRNHRTSCWAGKIFSGEPYAEKYYC
jgi:hypothetical protein